MGKEVAWSTRRNPFGLGESSKRSFTLAFVNRVASLALSTKPGRPNKGYIYRHNISCLTPQEKMKVDRNLYPSLT
jgi:hypothetical protein